MPSIPLHPTPISPPPSPAPTNPLPTLLHTPTGLAIIEIQGTINLPSTSTSTITTTTSPPTEEQQQSYETPVGKLVFPDSDLATSNRAYLYIGKHQRLTGEVKKLPTPLGVLRRRENPAGVVGEEKEWEGEELEILEIVQWKVLFSQRPEPVS
ncbi:hypothetical protein L873DRAFT_1678398 [Choiromyces venosus 120613-1]|uniref:Sister chromatid cohesion protein Ctf8 n=1 Tax=Choiromyces venosus 120613-1 TaxID=1336337 RepID=A0A3N4JRM2_9PEZI|nr:hypothetical protein L873DRAFT_1678398 [Choiromyces venosus 120613-1]